MRVIFGSMALVGCVALINLSGAEQVQDKKQKSKVLEVGKGFKMRSSLQNGRDMPYDAPDTAGGAQKKMAHQLFLVKLVKGQTYQIDMMRAPNAGMNPYLFLENANMKVLIEDDDSGDGDGDARIVFKAPADGAYRIICTTNGGVGEGDFELSVKPALDQKKGASSSHAAMLGKEAPNFTGDFAVNGEPVKLFDLKGKVVLLTFWEVLSSASVALMPELDKWNKAHKAKGLETVSVTYYASDIGRKLGFDKETGQVTKLKEADNKSDQALLKNFASYHKIDHLLLALAKQDAVSTFEAYGVNGLPQIVLIDRKGAVRHVQVGMKNATEIESELKKLLAQ